MTEAPSTDRPKSTPALVVTHYGDALAWLLAGGALTSVLLLEGGVLMTVAVPIALLHVWCALALQRNRRSGTVLQSLFAAVGMLRLPIGTVLSVITFRALDRRAVSYGRWILPLWAVELTLILWIAGMNIFIADQRVRRKETMTEMRRVASSLEAKAADIQRYPPTATVAELMKALCPAYCPEAIKTTDGWGTPFRYAQAPDGQGYTIVSAGSDRRFEFENPLSYTANMKAADLGSGHGGFADSCYSCDMVFRDGNFIRFPEYPGHHDE